MTNDQCLMTKVSVRRLVIGHSANAALVVRASGGSAANRVQLPRSGEVSEWPKEQHWKCCNGLKPIRGFESLPLRFSAERRFWLPPPRMLEGIFLRGFRNEKFCWCLVLKLENDETRVFRSDSWSA